MRFSSSNVLQLTHFSLQRKAISPYLCEINMNNSVFCQRREKLKIFMPQAELTSIQINIYTIDIQHLNHENYVHLSQVVFSRPWGNIFRNFWKHNLQGVGGVFFAYRLWSNSSKDRW